MSARGIVYLVGAGPGDPRLLTLRALELIRSAETVAHDELISPEILALVPRRTELIAVGRRHGRGAIAYRLHPRVLERAREGRAVVRLKSGDPLIFGRGAEEAEELAEAGIPFEIVPGVSAAVGAAAYTGIPLTHRHHASSVTLLTGHWAAAMGQGSRGTIVLYMVAHRLRENLCRLVSEGCDPSTPAAYIAAATTSKQLVISGTLADLADKVGVERRADPALVIVGSVVTLHDRIRWLEKLPLRGRRVLVALAGRGPSKIAAGLRALGARVVERPGTLVEQPANDIPLESAFLPGPPVGQRESKRGALEEEAPELIVLPNSSAARGLLTRVSGTLLSAVPMLAIGPTIAETARRHGAQNVLCLPAGSVEAAVSNTIEAFRRLDACDLAPKERTKETFKW